MTVTFVLLLMLAGFGTGFMVGLTGIGGGALMTPMLMLLFGVSPNMAVGTDLWYAAATKFAATRISLGQGLIEWNIVYRLWYGSIPGAIFTLIWLHYINISDHNTDTSFIKQMIAVAVLWAGLMLVFQPLVHYLTRVRVGTIAQDIGGPTAWILTIVAGAIIGVLVTLTSVGAGALGTVVLLYLYPVRLSPRRLIATEIAHAIPLALVSGLGHVGLGNVDFSIMIPLLVGSIPGAVLGAMLSASLHPNVLKFILSATLLITGVKMWWRPR